MQTTLVVLVAIAILAGMAYLHKKNWGFTKLVFLSLIVGIVFGVSLQLMFGDNSNIVKIVSTGFPLLEMAMFPYYKC